MARWNAEWDRWCAEPGARPAVHRWAGRHACLIGLTCLREVLAACGEDRSIAPEVADRRLAAVVAEARGGDQYAARVALHRVFPGLVHRAAARASSTQRPLGLVLEDLMASAWLVIVDFPLERRPAKIAVNVIRDAENRIFGYVPRHVRTAVRTSVEDLPPRALANALLGPSPSPDPQETIDLVPRLLLEAVDSGLSVEDARLLAQLFVSDRSVTQIADAEGVTPRWVRMRRRWALDRLAELIVADPRVVRGQNTSSDVCSGIAFHPPVVAADE